MIDLKASLETRIRRVQEQVEEAAQRSRRAQGSVIIVAVSKTVDRPIMDAAFDAGLRHFGENRIQDAAAKLAQPMPSAATLHMIGQLQTNKAQVAVRLFDVIESVDRLSLIGELQKQGEKHERRISVLLQVNIAGEQQKAGCETGDVDALVADVLCRDRLELKGLMTIAPLVDDAEAVRPVFRALRELRDRLLEGHPGLELPILSMGMSNDFTVAIEEGATHVRVGRAIFAS